MEKRKALRSLVEWVHNQESHLSFGSGYIQEASSKDQYDEHSCREPENSIPDMHRHLPDDTIPKCSEKSSERFLCIAGPTEILMLIVEGSGVT